MKRKFRKNLRRVDYSDGNGSFYCAFTDIEQGRTKLGFFHKWVEKSKDEHKRYVDCRDENNIYALIENSKGLLLLAHYTCVKFMD